MTTTALRADGVWKAYPRWAPGSRTVRGALSRRLPSVVTGEHRWVLRDVSLTVGPGESVGVIGRNGSGKSTLLRLLAGLGRPSRGTVQRDERLRAVLALGDTFDPVLSGRENAVTAAVVAGLSPREARALLPDAFAFAELEDFVEAPVRTYSDGMKLRLAMAVALHVPTRVLVLDEVMAVGDLRFQDRCMDRLAELRDGGLTVVFASHDLDRVAQSCDRAIWLDGGRLRLGDASADVVQAYRAAMMSETLERTPAEAGDGDEELELGRTRYGSQEAVAEEVVVRGPQVAWRVACGEPLEIAMTLRSRAPDLTDCVVAVAVKRRRDGLKCIDVNTSADGYPVELSESGSRLELLVEELPLGAGEYEVEIGVYRRDWEYAFDLHTGAHRFEVTGEDAGEGMIPVHRRWEVREWA